MDKVKGNLPLVILIVVEFILGLFVLISHDLFTKIVVVLFGIMLMVIGIFFLVRSLSDKEEGYMNWIAMAVSVVACVVGVCCTFFCGRMTESPSLVAVVYGVMLILSGLFKLKAYLDASRSGVKPPMLTLISAVTAFILGAVVVVNPFSSIDGICIFSGIALMVQAAIDTAVLVFRYKLDR